SRRNAENSAAPQRDRFDMWAFGSVAFYACLSPHRWRNSECMAPNALGCTGSCCGGSPESVCGGVTGRIKEVRELHSRGAAQNVSLEAYLNGKLQLDVFAPKGPASPGW